jgi:hypothetical protein
MLSMISLLSHALAASRSDDAIRAGLRTRSPRRPHTDRAALLERVRGRRGMRPHRPAHA